MTDWVTLADVGTAAGTLVLAGATFVAEDPGGPARHLRGDLPPSVRTFAPQQRDLLISTRRAGFWQAALRDPETPLYQQVARGIETAGRITVDILYGDHEGGQPAIARFVLLPEAGPWRCDATRHWSLPGRKPLLT
jgi:hypothetical protein